MSERLKRSDGSKIIKISDYKRFKCMRCGNVLAVETSPDPEDEDPSALCPECLESLVDILLLRYSGIPIGLPPLPDLPKFPKLHLVKKTKEIS